MAEACREYSQRIYQAPTSLSGDRIAWRICVNLNRLPAKVIETRNRRNQ